MTPEGVWQQYGRTAGEAQSAGMNPQMFNSFLDGTKSAIEMAAIANACTLDAPSEGLLFPPCGVDDQPHVMRPRDKGGVLRAHQKVITAAGDGEITSGTFSPSLSLSIALARLPKEVPVGTDVQVEIRDRKLTATVVKLPFVRNGKALVS